jgi:hypothetical protein
MSLHRPATRLDVARQLANAITIPLGMAASFVLVPLAAVVDGTGPELPGETGILRLARWAFVLRLVIFLGQLGYAIDQSLASRRAAPVLRRIGWLTALDAVLGAAWLAAWSLGRRELALALLGASLVNLIAIEVLRRDGARVGLELLVVRVPYSLALGFTSVLVVAAGATFLRRDLGWTGAPLPAALLPIGAIAAVTALACALTYRRPNMALGVAFAWGLGAVLDAARGHSSAVVAASTLAIVAIAGTVVATIVVLARTRRETSFYARALADA